MNYFIKRERVCLAAQKGGRRSGAEGQRIEIV